MTEAGAPLPASLRPSRAFFLLTGACVVAFANTFANKFVLDDNSIIVANSMIKSLANWTSLFTSPYWGTQSEDLLYRPLTVLTYAVDRALSVRLWGGDELDPWLFHFNNLVFHALATLALWRFLDALLRDRADGARIALGGALLFAVHPIHTEAVTGIVGRAEVLCGLFYFLGALQYLRYRAAASAPEALGRYLLCAVCFVLSLLSKEMGLTLPGVLFLCDAYGVATADGGPRWRELLSSRIAAPQVGFAIVILFYFVARHAVLGYAGPTATIFALYATPLHVRLLTAATVLADYVRMLFVPTGLRADYAVNVVPAAMASGWGDPWAWGSVAALGCLVVLAVRLARHAPEASFAIGWFFLSILPVANVLLPIGCVKAERFLYLPSVAGVLALALVLRAAGARAATVAVGALALVFLAGTIARNGTWKDEKTLYADAIAKDPEQCARAYCWLGSYWFAWHNPEEALRNYNRAIAIMDQYPQFFEARGKLYRFENKREAALADFDRAVEYSVKFSRYGVAHPRLLQARGYLRKELKDLQGAQEDLFLAAKLNPLDVGILNDCGVLCLDGLQRYDQAVEFFQLALAREPGNAFAIYNRGRARYYKKDHARAMDDFNAALGLDPSLDQAYEARGVCLYDMGDKANATKDLLHAVQLNASAGLACNYLVLCLLDAKQVEEARRMYAQMKTNGMPIMPEVQERMK